MNHVRLTTDENIAWCGETLGSGFYFKDAEAAALNGVHGGKPLCGSCLTNIIRALDNNRRGETNE